jgi:hypothetical protein
VGLNNVFDLYLLPLKLAGGQEIHEMPGLLVATAPRRCDRSRAADTLMVSLSLTGNAVIEPGMHEEYFQKVVSAYYRTRGTVTAGLRTAVGQLNDQLTRRNLRERGASQLLAVLNIAVLRRDMLYLAQSGATQSLLITKDDFTRFYDADTTGRGLGLSRSFNLRFWQAHIEPGDLLIFAAQPPSSWTAETLAGSVKLTLDQFRRRLLNQAGADVEAGVIQFKPGDGQLHRLKPRQTFTSPEATRAAEDDISPSEDETAMAAQENLTEVSPVSDDETTEQVEQPLEPDLTGPADILSVPYPVPLDEVLKHPAAQEPEHIFQSPDLPPTTGIYLGDASPRQPAPLTEPAAKPAKGQPTRPPFKFTLPKVNLNVRKPLANAWRAGKSARRKVDTGGRTVAGRLLPDRSPSLSPGAMLFIAIAIPLLIVASAVTVYFYAPSGRNEQQQAYITQALEFVELATAQSDSTLKRNNWDQVMHWVNKAEEYGSSSETVAIRRQARAALDAMDGVNRLILEPAVIGGFPNTIQISQIVASITEVFVLDAEEGRVLRLFKTAQGYEIDSRFNCGPGPSGTLMISPLVDIELLPSSHPSSVLAVDKTGNLLYCAAGENPTSVQLPVPDPVWGEITTMTIDQGILYLLDRPNNRIWLFVGQNFTYSSEPRLFFNDEVPQLNDVVDMVANNEDLYLLHENGMMTSCIFRSFSFAQTRCTDPAYYNDQRPGRSLSVKSMPGTQFIQMQTTSPPDPSLYMLDAIGPSIYHFSLRLNLQNQFSPDPEIEYSQPGKRPSAFAISSNRTLYLAIGNQVYYVTLSY